jgi:hypothetical protein
MGGITARMTEAEADYWDDYYTKNPPKVLFFRLKDRDDIRAGKAHADLHNAAYDVVLGVQADVDHLDAQVARFVGEFVVFQGVFQYGLLPVKLIVRN